MTILQVKDLVKTYGKDNTTVMALNGVSFSVEKGEFVAVVGASGSGKSTLMHLIGGVDRPTSGSVVVDGVEIFKLNESELAIFRRRKIGIISSVLQSHSDSDCARKYHAARVYWTIASRIPTNCGPYLKQSG